MAHPDRPTAAARSRDRLVTALGLTAAFFVVGVLGALWTGSRALLADAGHMLTDVGGTALALFAIWIASRPPTPAKTYGYYRAEILAALVNALVLLVVAGAVLVEAYRRLRAPPEVLGGPMLAVGIVGLAANLGCAWLLHADAATSLNVRGVHDLHVWTLTSGREAMSAHVVVTDVAESDRLLRQLHEVLHARFGIDHTTIQLEMEPPVVLRIQGSNPV